jgi:hypothetical protein
VQQRAQQRAVVRARARVLLARFVRAHARASEMLDLHRETIEHC